ncbi:MAG: hypothetical protein KDA91_10860 [Planctomycetaceae bacterium]|nr:hypothetical protein [Planctomycetaceae bacterium]
MTTRNPSFKAARLALVLLLSACLSSVSQANDLEKILRAIGGTANRGHAHPNTNPVNMSNPRHGSRSGPVVNVPANRGNLNDSAPHHQHSAGNVRQPFNSLLPPTRSLAVPVSRSTGRTNVSDRHRDHNHDRSIALNNPSHAGHDHGHNGRNSLSMGQAYGYPSSQSGRSGISFSFTIGQGTRPGYRSGYRSAGFPSIAPVPGSNIVGPNPYDPCLVPVSPIVPPFVPSPVTIVHPWRPGMMDSATLMIAPAPLELPCELGQIVDVAVPLETCVKVEDLHNIAPNAVPVVVAVRDPHMSPWTAGCIEPDRIVFVEVMAPPCPLKSLKISPCRTRIEMKFGDYEIDIRSTNDVIVIDYDD